MKTKITLLLIIICGLLSGCTKVIEATDARDVIVKSLTGAGNKRWLLRKVFVNKVPQTLTDFQLNYWVDFTIVAGQSYMGTWEDRDGNEGKWRLPSTQDLKCSFTNSANPEKAYVINSITATEMDIEYTTQITNITTREVYNAN